MSCLYLDTECSYGPGPPDGYSGGKFGGLRESKPLGKSGGKSGGKSRRGGHSLLGGESGLSSLLLCWQAEVKVMHQFFLKSTFFCLCLHHNNYMMNSSVILAKMNHICHCLHIVYHVCHNIYFVLKKQFCIYKLCLLSVLQAQMPERVLGFFFNLL